MRAAVYHGRGDIRIEEVPEPVIGPDDVLMEVRACGVCGTDAAEFANGPLMLPIERRHAASGHQGPMIPGHEFAGRIVALGANVEGLAEGEWAVTGAGVWCGECARCRSGKQNLCVRYWTLGLQAHGGLAEYCAVPATTIVRAQPYELEGDVLGLAQPLSIAVHSMRQGRARAGETAVVVGVGGIGAFLVYALARTGLQVIASDLDEGRRGIARDLGAEETHDPALGPLTDALSQRDVDVVYEVTGSLPGLDAAMEALPTAARLVAVGLHEQTRAIDLRALTLRENEIIGTNAHVCPTDMPESLRLLAAHDGDWRVVAPLALPLDLVVEQALEPLAERRSTRIKTLIDPWASEPRQTDMPAAARRGPATGSSQPPARQGAHAKHEEVEP